MVLLAGIESLFSDRYRFAQPWKTLTRDGGADVEFLGTASPTWLRKTIQSLFCRDATVDEHHILFASAGFEGLSRIRERLAAEVTG